ncbi:sugar kinase [Streptomyces sp. NBC_00876]|uniref:sugar kinase n=1 Tax=Streptomyces sp. NBC_00876 TaxID=2975853 RepID=UPI003869BF9B|nr:sugar kinase [Streptomyces sp. NBC_00876]
MTASTTPTERPQVRPPVVCIGETMVALVPEPAAPLEGADQLGVRIAGAESNVAMYLAGHGVPARWVSALGDDPFGRRIRGEVAASGVDVSGVRTDPHRPTGLLVKDPGTDGTRVHYYRRGSAASALTPDLLDEEAVRTAGLIHLSGITPALSEGCRDLVAALLEPPAAERTRPVSFDVNHRPALWPDGAAPGALLALARQADITFVGLDEAQALWGEELADAAAVRALLPQPRVLVVKDGGRAATAFDGDRVHTVPAPAVDVVEPVGAGDAFAAGFLAGLLRGEDTVRALRLGHLTAGAALRVTGDHGPLPDRARIAELLDAGAQEWARGG